MGKTTISQDKIEQTIAFHGHWCPGLAIGIRAAEVALDQIGPSSDEEVVAVVETDMCGVDAIQFLTSCTLGKGNLIHLDYGKNAFTFMRRSDGKSIRIVTRPRLFDQEHKEVAQLHKKMAAQELGPQEQERLKKARAALSQQIMEASLDDLFEVKPAAGTIPKKARILESVVCQACGERTMESRIRRFMGQYLCLPCFEARERRR
ncbi:MAG: formylmethanofuran dehydrogenase [Deltaproteobacteria bacterium]|nr:formylmethanofuran dehydrogenase [Deltaproteobacteria bacterium]